MTRSSSPSILTSVPAYFEYRTRSPALDVDGDALAVLVPAARADGEDLALLGLLLGGVRDHEAGPGDFLRVERADDDAVLERLDARLRSSSHGVYLLKGLGNRRRLALYR